MMYKLVNEMLEELLTLEAEVKPKLKRIEELKDWCKEQGTFTTDEYVCSVTTSVRTSLASLAKVAGAFGMHALESCGLLNTVQINTVKVSKIKSIVPNREEQDAP